MSQSSCELWRIFGGNGLAKNPPVIFAREQVLSLAAGGLAGF
jgi:hypothetical protein